MMHKLLSASFLLMLAACNPFSSNRNAAPTNQQPQPTAESTVVVAPPVDNAIKFDTYCNGRFGYCIDYPAGIIYPQPESTNGDGRVFKNKQGDEVLTVYGRFNLDANGETISLAQQFDNDLHGDNEENGNKDRVITYQKLGTTFYVISGYKKGIIFYQKTIQKGDFFAFAILRYKEEDKALYDKVSERIFQSFK